MNAIDLECVPSRGASAQLLRVLLVDQHGLINIGERDVVLGILFPLPDVKRRHRVKNRPSSDGSAYPAWHGLDVVDWRDRLRVVAGCWLIGHVSSVRRFPNLSRRETPIRYMRTSG